MDLFEIFVIGVVVIDGLMFFGSVFRESLDDYDKVMVLVDMLWID